MLILLLRHQAQTMLNLSTGSRPPQSIRVLKLILFYFIAIVQAGLQDVKRVFSRLVDLFFV